MTASAVYPDMKSHTTGGVISFGCRGIVCKSTKQKLNTKVPQNIEFVGASDYLPNTVWVQSTRVLHEMKCVGLGQ